MGAVFRSPESLVLSLPQFIWKQLVGEPVTWTRDFITVDSAEVKFIDSIETMEQEKFDASFSGCLNFVTVLSNGSTVNLPGGEEREVTYEDRLDYCRCVKEIRMKEAEQQIKALKEGLFMVVPEKGRDSSDMAGARRENLRQSRNTAVCAEEICPFRQ